MSGVLWVVGLGGSAVWQCPGGAERAPAADLQDLLKATKKTAKRLLQHLG